MINRISFKIQPFNFDTNPKEWLVEKTDRGMKRRYMRGVSSGIMKDGQGERLTLNAITSMMEQGQQGDIPLFAGKHGFDYTNDIGLLTNSEIVDKRDWLTEYRLFDEGDDVPEATIQKCNHIWNQVNGLAPYKKPKQKGFSIEGAIPENGIISAVKKADGTLTQRVIDKIDIDGTLLTDRPAYRSSVATAVYKALGELEPAHESALRNKLSDVLRDSIAEGEQRRTYFDRYWEINRAFEEQIDKIMKIGDRPDAKLDVLFDEYKTLLIPLILENAGLFQNTEDQEAVKDLIVSENLKQAVLKMTKLSKKLSNQLRSIKHG